MGLPRSTYYDAPPVKTDDAEIVANITAICDEFEAYGYRRVGAELRHRGMVVNSKKIRRLMREHDLQPKRRRHSQPANCPLSGATPSFLTVLDPVFGPFGALDRAQPFLEGIKPVWRV